MNWTISVWADFNISVNFYPLVPFISIFFFPVLLLRILQVQYGRHQGISVRIPHPLILYQTEARRAEKIFFRPPPPPPPPHPLSQGLDELLFCLSKPITFSVLVDVAVVLK